MRNQGLVDMCVGSSCALSLHCLCIVFGLSLYCLFIWVQVPQGALKHQGPADRCASCSQLATRVPCQLRARDPCHQNRLPCQWNPSWSPKSHVTQARNLTQVVSNWMHIHLMLSNFMWTSSSYICTLLQCLSPLSCHWNCHHHYRYKSKSFLSWS